MPENPFTRIGLSALVLAGEIALSACYRPNISSQSEKDPVVVTTFYSDRDPNVQPLSPMEQRMANQYKGDFMSSIKKFLNPRYIRYGIRMHFNVANNLEDNEWFNSGLRGLVGHPLSTGPGGRQEFYVLNAYENEKIKSVTVTTGNMWPIGNIDLGLLPSSVAKSSYFGRIPQEQLEEAGQNLFRLNSGVRWERATLCLNLPLDERPRRELVAVAEGKVPSGEYMRIVVEPQGHAELNVVPFAEDLPPLWYC